MSGWLEFYSSEIICPNCGNEFTATFTEDGNTKTKPYVSTGLSGGKTRCLICNAVIIDADITEYEYQTINVICPHCKSITKFNEGKDVNRCSVCARFIYEDEALNVQLED